MTAYDMRPGKCCDWLGAQQTTSSCPVSAVFEGLIGVQDRPCARCVKRSIGHLCHDEPREPPSSQRPAGQWGRGRRRLAKHEGIPETALPRSSEQQQVEQQLLQGAGLDLSSPALPTTTQVDPAPLSSASPSLGTQRPLTGAQNPQRKTPHPLIAISSMLTTLKLWGTLIGVGKISSMTCTIIIRHICLMHLRSPTNTICSMTF